MTTSTYRNRLLTTRLILLDRDGVINVDSADYIKNAAEWRPEAGALEAIVSLQAHFRVAICSNQSGIGRGLFNEDDLLAIHEKMNVAIKSLGGAPLDVFYCPHLPDAACPCRKPNPGLLLTAIKAANKADGEINARSTVFVGDSMKDLLAADAASCVSALVLTGNGKKTHQALKKAPDHTGIANPSELLRSGVFDSLASFAQAILSTRPD